MSSSEQVALLTHIALFVALDAVLDGIEAINHTVAGGSSNEAPQHVARGKAAVGPAIAALTELKNQLEKDEAEHEEFLAHPHQGNASTTVKAADQAAEEAQAAADAEAKAKADADAKAAAEAEAKALADKQAADEAAAKAAQTNEGGPATVTGQPTEA